MCADGGLVCVIVTVFWELLNSVIQAYQATVQALISAWTHIQPHLQWIGPLFGIAMAAWRWWDRRESVVWRRVARLLGDQGRYVQNCCRQSLAAILYPGPATPAQRPIFAVPALRRIFARRWWSPVRLAGPITWADSLMRRTHVQLDEKDAAITLQRSFAVAQRYSAHVLLGALSAARARSGKDDQERNRLNQTALDRFEDALALEGKNSDAVVLELKCLQLRKLDRPDAGAELARLQVLLEGQLQGVTPLPEHERELLQVQLLRVARYQGEIDHELNAHARANARFLGVMQNTNVNSVFQDHLEHQDRLERANYHEVHACARVRLTGTFDGAGSVTLPPNGVALQSLAAARIDYNALAAQANPRRFRWPVRLWRWSRRADRKDGSARLRVAASQGLQRLQAIQAGKGCQFCRGQNNKDSALPVAPIAPTGSA
jgi:hypothetical protein